MKEKILYISDRPSMGADMLIRNLGMDYEILRVRSGDEINHVPEIIFVNLSGLESSERIKTFTNSRIFVLGSQSEAANCDIANSGANALKILSRAKPDLILLDYEMPEMNGPQVLETLRADPETANIPVMFLTAKSDSGSIERIEALKPEGHMLKTLPLREIKAIIQKFFDGK